MAGTLAVDNNKSACCALGGAARPPRAIDILTISKVLAMTTSAQVRPATHSTQPTPCPISVILFAAETSTSSGAAILLHGPAWGSLAAFFNKFFDSTTRGQQASFTSYDVVAAAGLTRVRFDAAEWRRGQALAEQRYSHANAYDSVCLVSAVRTRNCISAGNQP